LVVDRARAFEEQHLIAETLQHSLLPHTLPGVEGMAMAARYLAGAPGVSVGGDWYDAVPDPDGRIVLVIGDVGGRGVRAASVMGQLRAACRIYLGEGYSAASVLERLNTLALSLGNDLATVALLTVDPSTRTASLVSAGHPPIAVRRADGRGELIAARAGIVLGATAHAVYEPADLELRPGDVLVLYTDGLVERRDQPIGAGLGQLIAAMEGAPSDPDAFADRLLGELVPPGAPPDDVALLVARL
jgi:serine phosphatase RsbU (regulator of sigma subunit)